MVFAESKHPAGFVWKRSAVPMGSGSFGGAATGRECGAWGAMFLGSFGNAIRLTITVGTVGFVWYSRNPGTPLGSFGIELASRRGCGLVALVSAHGGAILLGCEFDV